MNRYDYHQPESLDEAFRLKKNIPDSFYISGGTDLMVRVNKKELRPSALISLRSIPNLAGIDNGEIVRIGSMTTINEISKNTLLKEKFPVLAQAAQQLGCAQIQNVATVGGNLSNGSPAADMALPLLLLDAKVRIRGDKKGRELPIEKFFLGPGKTDLSPEELLTGILLKSPGSSTKAIFLKKGRMKMDLSIASVAVLVTIEDHLCLKARVAAGSVAPIPLRLFDVEALLEGATLTQDILNEAQRLAMKGVSPITDIRSNAEYRRHMTGVLVKRALEKLRNNEFMELDDRDSGEKN